MRFIPFGRAWQRQGRDDAGRFLPLASTLSPPVTSNYPSYEFVSPNDSDESPGHSVDEAHEVFEKVSVTFARVVPQRITISSPTLAEARELAGNEHASLSATIVIEDAAENVQRRLLESGYAVQLVLKQSDRWANQRSAGGSVWRTSEMIAREIETLQPWEAMADPTAPGRTLLKAPKVDNSDDGWTKLSHGVRAARGSRVLRVRVSGYRVTAFTRREFPAPPEGFTSI